MIVKLSVLLEGSEKSTAIFKMSVFKKLQQVSFHQQYSLLNQLIM